MRLKYKTFQWFVGRHKPLRSVFPGSLRGQTGSIPKYGVLSRLNGQITADLILQGHSGLIDAAHLSVERFREGRLLEETAVL
jgi:hypothetical protein